MSRILEGCTDDNEFLKAQIDQCYPGIRTKIAELPHQGATQLFLALDWVQTNMGLDEDQTWLMNKLHEKISK